MGYTPGPWVADDRAQPHRILDHQVEGIGAIQSGCMGRYSGRMSEAASNANPSSPTRRT